MSTNNTQLPVEVVEQINNNATVATDKEELRLKENNPHLAYGPMLAQLNGFKRGHAACATEYATKLLQATDLLKKMQGIYEAGLRPSKEFNDKIKKFLYGE